MKPRLAVPSGTSAPSVHAADSTDTMYGQHLAKVKRWARRLAGPSADLEDLVHDIFLIALRKGFQFRSEATIDTWLFGITQRVVWSKRRKSQLRQWLFGQNQTDLVPVLRQEAIRRPRRRGSGVNGRSRWALLALKEHGRVRDRGREALVGVGIMAARMTTWRRTTRRRNA